MLNSLLLAAATATLASHNGPVEYAVKPGDTLSGLVDNYIVPEHDWHDLQRIWRVSDPRHLPARETFAIPRQWLRWAHEPAKILSIRGSVTLKINGRAVSPSVGVALREGAEISTGANSFATLVLANGSHIALPSQSHVILSRLRKFLINGSIDYRLNLDQGRINATATPLKNSGDNLIVNTPLSMTAVRGTQYTVAFDSVRETSGTGVLKGVVAVARTDGSLSQLVPARFGMITDALGKRKQMELLRAPELKNPKRVQADDLVTFDLTPVPGALGYHALLASDAGFVDSYSEQEATVPHFEFSGVPNGNQFVRITAIGEDGMPGLRQSYAFSRHLASIDAEVSKGEDGFVFKWSGQGEGERHYRLQIRQDIPDGKAIVDEVGLTGNEATIHNLPVGIYFWRIAVSQTDSEGSIENWTEPEKLTVLAPGGS